VSDPDWQRPPGPHGYGSGLIHLFVCLVLVGGCSLRGASRVLGLLFACLGWAGPVPHWTSGRLWLLRLGHARLHRPKERARDWAWLIDHSVQLGPDKALVVLGLRLAHLPAPGQCLRHQDLHLLALVPMPTATRQDVHDELEKVVPLTGVPRLIVDDHGVDLTGGVGFFQQQHPRTAEVYDAKHKGACLLKHRLERDDRWAAFNVQVGQTRSAIQQTELAFLVPPGPRPKARFMNLGPLLGWGQKVLAVLGAAEALVRTWVRPERLEEKLGWLKEYQDALREWAEWQQLIDTTVFWVGAYGLERTTAAALAQRLGRPLRHPSSEQLADQLEAFVAEQAWRARPGQRFPGSTEVVESCFGRFKALQRGQAKGGLTGLLLAFGTLLGGTTTAQLRQDLQASQTQDVRQWCKEHLGTTLPAKRKRAFQRPKAQQKPDERSGP
jgi:hypothetical protein